MNSTVPAPKYPASLHKRTAAAHNITIEGDGAELVNGAANVVSTTSGAPINVYGLPDAYKRLSAAAIWDAAREYLNTNNYVQVTLYPEK